MALTNRFGHFYLALSNGRKNLSIRKVYHY